MKKLVSFLVWFTVSIFTLSAQQFMQILDPDQQHALPKSGSDYDIGSIPFLFYEYKNETLDLSHFRLSYPFIQEYLPRKIDVQPPTLGWVENLSYGLSFLTNGEHPSQGKLVVIFVGDYQSPFPKYFIDYNLNHDFTDDSGPFVFKNTKKKQKQITLRGAGASGNNLEFFLLNPAYQLDINTAQFAPEVISKEKENPTSAQSIENKQDLIITQDVAPRDISIILRKGIFLNLGMFTGGGKLTYTSPITDYRVFYNPRGLNADLSFALSNIHFGAFVTLQSIYYQTSFLQESNGYYSNIDWHPRKKTSYGAFLGYHVRIAKSVGLIPFVQYSKYSFDTNYYIPNNAAPEVKYPLTERYSYGFGRKNCYFIGT